MPCRFEVSVYAVRGIMARPCLFINLEPPFLQSRHIELYEYSKAGTTHCMISVYLRTTGVICYVLKLPFLATHRPQRMSSVWLRTSKNKRTSAMKGAGDLGVIILHLFMMLLQQILMVSPFELHSRQGGGG